MRAILDWWTVAALVAIVLLGAVLARGAESQRVVLFYNAGLVPVTRIELCSESGVCAEGPVDCGAASFCDAPLTLPDGRYPASIRVSDASGNWSPPSNVVDYRVPDPRVCMDDEVCRSDFDGNRTVTVSDFAVFLRSMGASW